ncbi:HEAT repeat domain-containing protein [Archangium violaceum]|uniref:HEAT repeat domain-containing protein n=1 Tax=Archangium violaceum TaxID=83451 RepID=UPI0036DDEDE4
MTKTLLDHPGAESFLSEFQEEHLSEVEFLLQQRRRLLHAPGARWTDAEESETRLALHLAAMRASVEVALGCAQEAVASGDDGQFLAGLHVLASLAPQEAGIDALLEIREAALEEMLPTWTEALALARHQEVAGCCTRALEDERPQVRAAAASILGHRREGEPSRLMPLLEDGDDLVRGAAALALARLGHRPTLPSIEALLAHSPPERAEPLARAALLLGSRRALTFCRQLCNSGLPPPPLPRLLALAGDAQDLPVLRRLGARPALAEASLEALGLLGFSAAVPELLAHLEAEDPRLRQSAASALGLLSGAGPGLKLRVAAREDEEEGHEREEWSTDPRAWREWWDAHGRRFEGGQRWRHGRRFTLEGCLEELEDPHSPLTLRSRTALELVLHSGRPLDLEPDWPVRRQRAALTRWRTGSGRAGPPTS